MIAFKTQSQNASAPAGIPPEWPWIEEIIDDAQEAAYETAGFTCLSADAYILYKATYQDAYDAWFATQPTQFLADKKRFERRASAKNGILAEMAAENMARVRAGTWTTQQLIGLTQDAELKDILDDVNTLSFEIAASKIPSLANSLLTTEIKNGWIAKLQAHFYL